MDFSKESTPVTDTTSASRSTDTGKSVWIVSRNRLGNAGEVGAGVSAPSRQRQSLKKSLVETPSLIHCLSPGQRQSTDGVLGQTTPHHKPLIDAGSRRRRMSMGFATMKLALRR